MTQDEANKLAVIISNVDGGCPVCVSSTLADCMQAFLGVDWLAAARATDIDAQTIEDARAKLAEQLAGIP